MAVLGFKDQIMVSAFLKEATFDAGVTMNASNACSLVNLNKVEPSWDDKIANDKNDYTGKEHGYIQEIQNKANKISLGSDHATPNLLSFIAGLCLGSITSTQDGVTGAYKHKIVPVAAEAAIPSCQIEHLRGGVQYAYKGMKGASFKLSGKAGEYVNASIDIVGSGTRATSATAFVASITESWLKTDTASVWTETGATISIAGTLTQGAQNISSGAGTSQKVRTRSFELDWNNDLDVNYGFGGGGVAQEIRPKRRKCTMKATLDFAGQTDLDYFLNQTVMAIELDFKGGLIAGTTYAGAQIIIPRMIVTKATLPKGGINDIYSADFEWDIYDDGTNAALIIETYNQKATYLA